MADIKATSFRVSEEDLEKFKQFMEQEGIKTQADGFKSIMQSVEMAKAKNVLSDRGKEIETFQETINNLMSMFLNSLNVNQTSEERIREQLSLELNTKDTTIKDLQEERNTIKSKLGECKEALVDKSKGYIHLESELERAKEALVDWAKIKNKLDTQITESNKQIATLNEIVTEYKQYKDNYKVLEKELEQLKVAKTTLTNENKQLQDKLINNADMLSFYKENISKLENEIGTYKADIKTLEDTHKQEVAEVKAEHQKALQEQYSSKMDVEVSKKDLEIQKLQNEIEQLKADKAKQQHKPKATKSENI